MFVPGRVIREESPGEKLYRIRTKVLKLTQSEMVDLITGCGANAVSRYENGICKVPKPVQVIVDLLDIHPEYAPTILAIGASFK